MLQKHLPFDSIGHAGNAVQHIANGIGLLHRVATGFAGHERSFEGNEVLAALFDVLGEALVAHFTNVAIGVVAVGKEHHAHVQAAFKQQVGTAQRGFDTGRVAVVQHRHIIRVPLDEPDLTFGERSARRSHHVLDAALVQAEHVEVAFYQVADFLGPDGLPGLKQPVQHVGLVVNI